MQGLLGGAKHALSPAPLLLTSSFPGNADASHEVSRDQVWELGWEGTSPGIAGQGDIPLAVLGARRGVLEIFGGFSDSPARWMLYSGCGPPSPVMAAQCRRQIQPCVKKASN